jgi:hypothetical protein
MVERRAATRLAFLAVLGSLPLPALAECEYRTAFNYVTAQFEEVPFSCSREPVVAPRTQAQGWRQCPVREKADADGRIWTVRVCDPGSAQR